MFRSGLSIYLALVTLAGPSLCCCTAARAAASFLHSVSERPAVTDDDRPACCRHHAVAQQPQIRDERPRRESPGKPGCPCGHDPARAVVALDTESARQLQPAPAAQLPVEVLPPGVATPATPAGRLTLVPRERRALPFLSSSDLLRVFHLLRC